jgi:hypothetical protein
MNLLCFAENGYVSQEPPKLFAWAVLVRKEVKRKEIFTV